MARYSLEQAVEMLDWTDEEESDIEEDPAFPLPRLDSSDEEWEEPCAVPAAPRSRSRSHSPARQRG